MLTYSSVARLGDTLGGVEGNESLNDDPTAWLDSNVHQILAAATELQVFSRDDLTGISALLFPRLTIYTLAHATLQTKTRSLLMTLRENVSRWISMDPIAQLTSRKSIQEALLHIISQCAGENPLQDSQTKNILQIDIDSIAARLLVMLTNDHHRRLLVGQEKGDAQALLNLFQELIDLEHLAPIRPRILTTMLVLSKRSSLYPESLILQGVERQGESSVAGGSFGDVWMGTLKEEIVAIKVIRCLNPSAKTRTHEAVLWRQLNHLNVLSFYGVFTWEQGPRSALCLVSPWAEHGSITEYLRKVPDTDRAPLLLDVACGLEYLHTFDPPVIHGDLKGTNILVTASLRACIADFGLCTLTQHHGVRYTSSSSLGAGALLYRAPELLNRSLDERKHRNGNEHDEWMTLASDVYSFGCVCYELFTGRPRFHDLGIFDAFTAVRENRQLEKPDAMNDMLWELTQMCWQVDPILRPTASYVVEHLTSHPDQAAPCTPGRNYHSTPSAPPEMSSTSIGCPPSATDLSIPTIAHDECSEVHVSLHTPGSEVDPPPSSGESSETPPGDAQQISHQAGLTPMYNAVSSLTLLPDAKGWTPTKGDILIAVMGPSGTGKSSFIQHAMPNSGVVVSHELESCTQEVRAFACLHPNGSGRRVVLVDTPGFDDTERTDYEILQDIADWLKITYEGKVALSGILHFHSIAEIRMKGNPRKNLEMFQYLCGNDALENVILMTTHWDQISDDVASKREAELMSSFWKPFMNKGSRVARFHPSTFDSAWKIIDLFSDTPHRPLKVQKEMVDQGKELHETSAFKFLVRWWKGLIKRFNGMVRGSQSAPTEQELQRAMREQTSLDGNRSQRTTQPRLFTLRRNTTSVQRA